MVEDVLSAPDLELALATVGKELQQPAEVGDASGVRSPLHLVGDPRGRHPARPYGVDDRRPRVVDREQRPCVDQRMRKADGEQRRLPDLVAVTKPKVRSTVNDKSGLPATLTAVVRHRQVHRSVRLGTARQRPPYGERVGVAERRAGDGEQRCAAAYVCIGGDVRQGVDPRVDADESACLDGLVDHVDRHGLQSLRPGDQAAVRTGGGQQVCAHDPTMRSAVGREPDGRKDVDATVSSQPEASGSGR